MKKQIDTCVFAHKVSGWKCSAMSEYVCNNGHCKFYKSNKEYFLDENGFAERRKKNGK